jgi:hypothetical protein
MPLRALRWTGGSADAGTAAPAHKDLANLSDRWWSPGTVYATATDRAEVLNRHLYEFRLGRISQKVLDFEPGHGTVDWLIERYYRSRALLKVSSPSKPSYRHADRQPVGRRDARIEEGRRDPHHS